MNCSDAGCSFQGSADTEKFLCDRILDRNQPISERFRALFSLRNLRGPAPRNALVQATRDASNLLAHEAAFALGQMQNADAIPALEAVLNDLSLHPIVRHEVAYVLGQLQNQKASDALSQILRDSSEHPMVRYEAAVQLQTINVSHCLRNLLRIQAYCRTEL